MLAEVLLLWLDKTGFFCVCFCLFFHLTSLPLVAREGTASPRAMAVDHRLMVRTKSCVVLSLLQFEAEEDRGNIFDPRQ